VRYAARRYAEALADFEKAVALNASLEGKVRTWIDKARAKLEP
jgi:hypothetical protein